MINDGYERTYMGYVPKGAPLGYVMEIPPLPLSFILLIYFLAFLPVIIIFLIAHFIIFPFIIKY